MNTWYSKSLGDGLMAWEPLGHIEELFSAEHVKAGSPEEMAIFIRHESEWGLHCEVRAYFSPAAVAVARRVDAAPCARPSIDGLSLLAGAEESWALLFPE